MDSPTIPVCSQVVKSINDKIEATEIIIILMDIFLRSPTYDPDRAKLPRAVLETLQRDLDVSLGNVIFFHLHSDCGLRGWGVRVAKDTCKANKEEGVSGHQLERKKQVRCLGTLPGLVNELTNQHEILSKTPF